MEIRLFKTFLLVAELLNITRAAEQLSFSQPAITAQICSLEETFRVKLFERNGKRLTLTNAGKTMVDYAKQIVSLYEKTQNVMATFGHTETTIKLGASSQMVNYFLLPILKDLQTQIPSINITIDTCKNIQEVLKGIIEYHYDFGFIHGQNTLKQIRQHGIWKDDVLWVASQEFIKNHEEIKDGKDLPIINYNEGSVFRAKLDEITGKKNVQSLIEYSDSEAIKHAVIVGLGISYLSRTLIKDELATGKLVILKENPLIQLQISLVHHKDKSFTLPMYALLLALANQPCADQTIRELF